MASLKGPHSKTAKQVGLYSHMGLLSEIDHNDQFFKTKICSLPSKHCKGFIYHICIPPFSHKEGKKRKSSSYEKIRTILILIFQMGEKNLRFAQSCTVSSSKRWSLNLNLSSSFKVL